MLSARGQLAGQSQHRFEYLDCCKAGVGGCDPDERTQRRVTCAFVEARSEKAPYLDDRHRQRRNADELDSPDECVEAGRGAVEVRSE
jgi:hypothetical protein